MNKILFSAIGSTDPIRDCHDGGWLHCLRWIKPEKTVIYLSADMTENEDMDERYSKALKLLNEDLKQQGVPEIQIEIERRPNLVNPHEYGNLYSDIKGIITKIHKNNPEAEIYINCSSGTPAMKNCLADMRLLLPFGDRIHLLQVSDPLKGVRKNDGRVRKDYDLQTNWECNDDRDTDSVMRVQPLAPDQHDKMIRLIDVKKLVMQYDYEAARILMNEEKILENAEGGEKLDKALKGAAIRRMMLLQTAGALLNEAGLSCDMLQNEASKRIRQCAEMIMIMEQDAEKQHFHDMLLKITPVFFILCIEYILKHVKWDPTVYQFENGKTDWENLKKEHPDFARSLISENLPIFLSSSHLVSYIEQLHVPFVEIELIQKLRNVESAARNKAAHTFVGINNEWIRKMTRDKRNNIAGVSAVEILKDLKSMVKLIEPGYGNSIWNSYARMNEAICAMVDEIELKSPS